MNLELTKFKNPPASSRGEYVKLLPKRGKGSHSYWIHPLLSKPVILSGKDGGDAKPYQEQQVNTALKKVQQQGEDK